MRESRAAGDWRTYEYWDNRLHRAVAQATANIVLLALFDSLNTIRRTVTWGRLRRFAARPDSTHHSFAEHDRLVRAIAERDPGAAADAMRLHLRSVRDHLLMAADERRGTAGLTARRYSGSATRNPISFSRCVSSMPLRLAQRTRRSRSSQEPPRITCSCGSGPVSARGGVGRAAGMAVVPDVLDPLPDIAVHVVEAPRVGRIARRPRACRRCWRS